MGNKEDDCSHVAGTHVGDFATKGALNAPPVSRRRLPPTVWYDIDRRLSAKHVAALVP